MQTTANHIQNLCNDTITKKHLNTGKFLLARYVLALKCLHFVAALPNCLIIQLCYKILASTPLETLPLQIMYSINNNTYFRHGC